MQTYIPRGTCSRQITFDITDDKKVTNVKYLGGCPGNLQALAKLVEGMDIDEVIARLKGIQCRNGTSCSDQLANALIKYKENNRL